jgi:tetratricopeptide (TPR) repeat protein
MKRDLFNAAIELEQNGEIDQAMMLYEAIRSTDARAALNLGTIHYRLEEFERAEQLYRQATELAPDYALAWFNLGNALDELKQPALALKAYETSIKMDPRYADAHYNLALALYTTGEPRRAIRHWRAYVLLDPTSLWSDHARTAIRKTIEADHLMIVWRAA